MKPSYKADARRAITFAVLGLVLLGLAGTKSGAKENGGQGSGVERGLGIGGQGLVKPKTPIPNPQSPTPHHFWDKQNIALISAGGALRAADVYTTHRFLELGGRERLLPSGLVKNTVAFSSYSAGATAGTAGLAWLAHRRQHHRIERVILWTHAAFMAGLVANNAAYIHRLR